MDPCRRERCKPHFQGDSPPESFSLFMMKTIVFPNNLFLMPGVSSLALVRHLMAASRSPAS